jgi:hypothetical protein
MLHADFWRLSTSVADALNDMSGALKRVGSNLGRGQERARFLENKTNTAKDSVRIHRRRERTSSLMAGVGCRRREGSEDGFSIFEADQGLEKDTEPRISKENAAQGYPKTASMLAFTVHCAPEEYAMSDKVPHCSLSLANAAAVHNGVV